jgi:hypothetical protein
MARGALVNCDLDSTIHGNFGAHEAHAPGELGKFFVRRHRLVVEKDVHVEFVIGKLDRETFLGSIAGNVLAKRRAEDKCQPVFHAFIVTHAQTGSAGKIQVRLLAQCRVVGERDGDRVNRWTKIERVRLPPVLALLVTDKRPKPIDLLWIG